MIELYDFANFIEGIREYKAFLTHYLGDWCEDARGTVIGDMYYKITGPFIQATMEPMLLNMLETLNEVIEDDDEILPYNLFEEFVNYGYTYTIEVNDIPNEDMMPHIDHEGILLDNIEDFYNYWVFCKKPENATYQEKIFHSEDAVKIAQKYIKKLRDICYCDKIFVI